MIFLRYIGFGFWSGALLLTFYEIMRYLDTHIINLITVQQAWINKYESGLQVTNTTISENYFSGFFGDLMLVFINLPLLIVLILLGSFFVYTARHCDIEK